MKLLIAAACLGLSVYSIRQTRDPSPVSSSAPIGSAPAASPAKAAVTQVPVEIVERGKPDQMVYVPVPHSTIPEIGAMILAPIGWLLLLRRHR